MTKVKTTLREQIEKGDLKVGDCLLKKGFVEYVDNVDSYLEIHLKGSGCDGVYFRLLFDETPVSMKVNEVSKMCVYFTAKTEEGSEESSFFNLSTVFEIEENKKEEVNTMQFEEGKLIKELGFEFKERPDGMYGDVFYNGEKVSEQAHSEDTFNKMEVHTGRNGKQYATSNKKNHFVLPEPAKDKEVTGMKTVQELVESGVIVPDETNLLDIGMELSGEQLKWGGWKFYVGEDARPPEKVVLRSDSLEDAAYTLTATKGRHRDSWLHIPKGKEVPVGLKEEKISLQDAIDLGLFKVEEDNILDIDGITQEPSDVNASYAATKYKGKILQGLYVLLKVKGNKMTVQGNKVNVEGDRYANAHINYIKDEKMFDKSDFSNLRKEVEAPQNTPDKPNKAQATLQELVEDGTIVLGETNLMDFGLTYNDEYLFLGGWEYYTEVRDLKAAVLEGYVEREYRVVATDKEGNEDRVHYINKDHVVEVPEKEEPTQATEEVTGKYVKVGMMEDGSTPIYRAPDGSLVEGNFRDVAFRVQMNAKHTKKTTQFLEVAETIAEEQGLTNINKALNEHGKHLLDVTFMHFDMELKQD